jgi:hypothetical protein
MRPEHYGNFSVAHTTTDGCQHLREINAMPDECIDINIVSRLRALLYRQRLCTGDIEQRSNMHLRSFGNLRGAISPSPRLPKPEITKEGHSTGPPRSARQVKVWLTTDAREFEPLVAVVLQRPA